MGIDLYGWVDWAVRDPGPFDKTNGGTNEIRGIFLHSAEGYLPGLKSQLHGDARVSWHFSILFDGTLIQHYSVWAQCWHATAANNKYIGAEHEGRVPDDPTLTPQQVKTDRQLISELELLKGWKRSRGGIGQTLWEHREVTLLGGTSTSCPNGRIPWEEILKAEEPETEEVPEMRWLALKDKPEATVFRSYLTWADKDGLKSRFVPNFEEHEALDESKVAGDLQFVSIETLRQFKCQPDPLA